MPALFQIIPDVDILLSMAPEELAKVLLKLVPNHLQNGMFQPESVGRPPQLFRDTI
jgi:hypothetical protein